MFAADIRADGLERMRQPSRARPRARRTPSTCPTSMRPRRWRARAIDAPRPVHALVNCAGVMPGGPLLDVTRETFDLTFAVNARAPMATMQVVAAHMAEHGGGAIVNIASANAFKNESPEAPYNASKAALVALTKAAAHEWGHLNIRANCVAPGQTIDAGGRGRDRHRSAMRRACNASTCGGSRSGGPVRPATRRWPCCSSRRTTPRGSAARR